MTTYPPEVAPMPRRRPPSRRGAAVPLVIFAVLYLGVLSAAVNVVWVIGCVLVAAMVAFVGWRLGAAPRRKPTAGQLRWIGITSALEGLALAVAVIIAVATGVWWPVLPVMLTAVAVHFCALDIAFRRAVDRWAVVCTIMAATGAWILSRTALPWIWPMAAAVAAGVCLGYASALAAVRAEERNAADSDVPPIQEDDNAGQPHGR